MRGTKLWQSAGSPIIQGRSRTDRPYVQDWLAAVAVAVVIGVVYDIIASWPPAGLLRALSDAASALGVFVLLSVVPAALFVWLSRTLRWGKPWLTGGVCSALIGIGLLLLGFRLP